MENPSQHAAFYGESDPVIPALLSAVFATVNDSGASLQYRLETLRSAALLISAALEVEETLPPDLLVVPLDRSCN